MEILIKRGTNAPENAEHRATTPGLVFLDGEQFCFCIERAETLMPAGTYPVRLAWSNRFQRVTPHIDVPGHTNVEIHGANTSDDVHGCVGVAEKRLDKYTIYESEPVTSALENALLQAEANGEKNTVTFAAELPTEA